MIGSDSQITRPKKNPFADLSGLYKPRTISDSTTEDRAQNALASGYQKGEKRDYLEQEDAKRVGLSRSAMSQTKAAQFAAAGAASGAQEAAGIRSADQAFNEQQRAAHEQMVDDRLNSNYQLQTGMNAANFNRRFAGSQNRYSLDQARQRAQMSLRMALLSKLA
jgi:hypothetical protein